MTSYLWPCTVVDVGQNHWYLVVGENDLSEVRGSDPDNKYYIRLWSQTQTTACADNCFSFLFELAFVFIDKMGERKDLMNFYVKPLPAGNNYTWSDDQEVNLLRNGLWRFVQVEEMIWRTLGD